MDFTEHHIRQAGMSMVIVKTGGYSGHEPACRAYEASGFEPLPGRQIFKPLPWHLQPVRRTRLSRGTSARPKPEQRLATHSRHCETWYKEAPSTEVASPNVVDSRLASAFFDKVNVSEGIQKIISRQINVGRREQGGLWVGGRSVLTTSTLSFSPNDMNRAMHVDPEEMDIHIALSNIIDISVQRGIITDIINIRSVTGDLKIRCFKAKSFAAAIEATRLAAG